MMNQDMILRNIDFDQIPWEELEPGPGDPPGPFY